jgi:hypothetical protein
MQLQEEKDFDQAITDMRQSQPREGYPPFKCFKRAIYRFAVRSVLVDSIKEDKTLLEALCRTTYFWDK